MAKRLRKVQDVDGKQLLCLGKSPKEADNVALEVKHSDPSRRDNPVMYVTRGMVLRVPQDISVTDARTLLTIEEWNFKVQEQPQDAQQESKGDK